MQRSVLIVDDLEDTRAFMSELIKSFGYQVREAANGIEAVLKARENHPDLILMDITMPEMDGLSAVKVIRNSNNSIARVPIIAVSGYDGVSKAEAIDAGCDQFLSKPIDFALLEPALSKYLSH